MERNIAKDHSHIKDWGIDADPKNDPTYPLRDRSGDEKGYNWKRPPLQDVDIEVLHSIERPNITAVFGTAVPPSGLSGMIRRFAFKYSENSYTHWLPLVLADRVNEVEGIIEDIANGHFPNILAEKGMNAEWKYNRKNLIQKVVIGAVATSAAIMYFRRK